MARVSDPHENDLGTGTQPPNGKTIVLAEDDPFISRMYQTKLTSAGYNVVMANNGRDAYDKIKSINPDLVMLDINMPELSGFEVVRALIAEGSTVVSADRILVLTNSANPEDRKTATELHLDLMVKAEMTPRDVLAKINQKLGL